MSVMDGYVTGGCVMDRFVTSGYVECKYVTGSRTGLNNEELQNDSWNYNFRIMSKANSRVKPSSETNQPFNYLLKDNLQNVNGYAENLRRRLAPLTDELYLKMTVNTENLQRRIRQDLRTKHSPFADVVHQQLSRNLEEFHQKLTPYTEELRQQLKNNAEELRDTKSLQDKLNDNTKTQRDVLIPLTEAVHQKLNENIAKINQTGNAGRLKTKLDQGIQEILAKLLPDVEHGFVSVIHQAGEIPQNYPNSSEFKSKISENVKFLAPYATGKTGTLSDNRANQSITQYMKDLKKRLSPYAESLKQEIQFKLTNLSDYIREKVKNN
ncbi:apolipoprotein A-IV-like [Carcharodon carcharias]|uniref:apolipoprotein A-IV-like n=1 Tax=Carcharodon carcharias TaxID=13397 RepID=UPI001B7DE0B1|nr:apolipoprotein A-IV-like [Carcharodon carcharias]